MRLPYFQVAMEVLEQSAPEVAILLGCTKAEAFHSMAWLIPWALARCPDHEPPSINAVVRGAHAARLIADGVQWTGDADAFVETLCAIRFPMLERVEGGIRVRGLDRYDAAWGRNHADLWKTWKARLAATPQQSSSETAAEPTRNRSSPEAVPVRQTQTQTQTQTQKNTSPPPRARALAPVPPPASEEGPDLVPELERLWAEARGGARYEWTRADEEAVRALLGRPREEVVRRWRIALAIRFPKATCVADLPKHWNAYAQEEAPPSRDGKAPARSFNDVEHREGPVNGF